MPFNGSGVFTSVYSWVADAANSINISATRMDAQEADYTANGFGNCLTRDGQGSATANQPMNGYRHTGVGNGAALTDYLAVGQLKNGSILYAGTAGGTADALTGTTSPANTALTNGMAVIVKAASANATTTPTFVLDSIGSALTITKTGGVALAAGDIVGAGHELLLVYSSTGTRWELLNPANALGTSTGTGAVVRQTNASLITPALGTPQSGALTNCTSIPVAQATGILPAANGGAGTANGILQANGSGTVSAITVGSGLSFSGGTLSNSASVTTFVKSGIAMTTSTAGSQAHSLTPTSSANVVAYIQCTSTDNGYAVGDKLAISTISAAGAGGHISVGFNATNVIWAISNNALTIPPATGGAPNALTPSKWTLTIVMTQ